jgi:hypothetical protein
MTLQIGDTASHFERGYVDTIAVEQTRGTRSSPI